MYRHPQHQHIACREDGVILLSGAKFSFQSDEYTYYDKDSGDSINIGELRKAAKEYHATINQIIDEPDHGIKPTQVPGNDKLKDALAMALNTKIIETKHEDSQTKHETEPIKHENKHNGIKNSKSIGVYYHHAKPFTSSRELASYLEISNATAINWAKNNKKGCSFQAK